MANMGMDSMASYAANHEAKTRPTNLPETQTHFPECIRNIFHNGLTQFLLDRLNQLDHQNAPYTELLAAIADLPYPKESALIIRQQPTEDEVLQHQPVLLEIENLNQISTSELKTVLPHEIPIVISVIDHLNRPTNDIWDELHRLKE